ncbi:hypothetical protein KCG44_12135 [Pacificimonas sp. WHA3]|uniref:Uncharacterized protein n=1 Tax=Pacificimonas pallii TaxID=2827236 RepID=A0ABS6SGK6_9SPHN|nr:hypothetical protein [Pacificimonas pallii]MBV7257534.1 hypothetical protein [Pacificimonas pallii]
MRFSRALGPEHVGYHFGLLSAQRGLSGTFLAGILVILSLVAAWIAARRRPGKGHGLTALVCLALTVNSAVPAFTATERSVFQLGDFIRLEGLAAFAMMFTPQSVPTLIGVIWAASRVTAAKDHDPGINR